MTARTAPARVAAVLVTAATLVVALLLPAGSARAADPVRYTGASWIGGLDGGSQAFSEADGTVALTEDSEHRQWVQLTLPQPDGGYLTQGISYAFSGSLTAGATFSGPTVTVLTGADGRPETWGPVTLSVLEADRDPSGALTAIALDWTTASGFRQGSGQLRWHSSRAWAGVSTPTLGASPSTDPRIGQVSEPVTVPVRNSGPVALSLSAASLSSTDPTTTFHLLTDGCGGRVLAPGATCSLTLEAFATTGFDEDWLTLTATNLTQPVRIRLFAHGGQTAEGSYSSVSPRRVVDTRSGLGGGALGPGGSRSVRLVGTPVLPHSDVSAVVLTVTAVRPTGPTYLTAYPSGTRRPTTSVVNAAAGEVRAATITVRPGADGSVALYNAAGRTNVLVDVIGFYAGGRSATTPQGADLYPIAQSRLVDTRSDGGGSVADGEVLGVALDLPADLHDVSAIALNVTATRASAAGYLQVRTEPGQPNSTVNYAAGQTVANTAVAPLGSVQAPDGSWAWGFEVANTGGPVHVLVDAVGLYARRGQDAGLAYHPLDAPLRVLDSRTGRGASGPWGTAQTRAVTVTGLRTRLDTLALDGTVTQVRPTRTSWLTVFGDGESLPNASSVNAPAGRSVANSAVAPLLTDRFLVHNGSGSSHVLFDVDGLFDLFPGTYESAKAGVGVAGARPSATRSGGPSPSRTLRVDAHVRR